MTATGVMEYSMESKQETYHGIPYKKWSHKVVAVIIRAFLKVFARFEVKGMENVPKEGPAIVVSNHLSNFDPIIILLDFPRWVNFMGKEELWRHPFFKFIMPWAHVFPVVQRGDSLRGLRDSMRNARKVLGDRLLLGIFPEGTRSKTRQLQPALPGAMFIALENDALLIPVAVTGTENFIDLTWLLRRPRITVTVGKPFRLPKHAGGPMDKDLLASMGTITMQHIAELLPPEYRGLYAGNNHEATSHH
jgi:1-acyl-sn-glycerol-3-phosphate acyltransferase